MSNGVIRTDDNDIDNGMNVNRSLTIKKKSLAQEHNASTPSRHQPGPFSLQAHSY